MMNFFQMDNARILAFGKVITAIMIDQGIDLSIFPSVPPEDAFQKKNLGLMQYKLYSFPITIDSVATPRAPRLPSYQPDLPSSSALPSQDVPQSPPHVPGPSSPPSGPQYLFPPPAVLSLHPADYGIPDGLAGLFRHQTDLAIATMNAYIVSVNRICRTQYSLLSTASSGPHSPVPAAEPLDSDEYVEQTFADFVDTAATMPSGTDSLGPDTASEAIVATPVASHPEDTDRASTPPDTTIHDVLQDIASQHPAEDTGVCASSETREADLPEETSASALPSSETHPTVSSELALVSPVRKKRKLLVPRPPSFRTEPSIYETISRSHIPSQSLESSIPDPSARPAPHLGSMDVEPLAFSLPGSTTAMHPCLLPAPVIVAPPSPPRADRDDVVTLD